MRTWVVAYEDSAAGMVRYAEKEFEAESEKEARTAFDKWMGDCGPGICVIEIWEKKL